MVKGTLIWLDVVVRVPTIGALKAVADGVKVDELEDAVPAPLALLAVTVQV